jgi:hypothetical protein
MLLAPCSLINLCDSPMLFVRKLFNVGDWMPGATILS